MPDLVVDADLTPLDPDRRGLSYPALLSRRMAGTFAVDEWGYDADLAIALAPLAALRQHAALDGVEHLPEIGAALLVANHRFGPLEPLLLAAALSRECRRPVRFAGVPDLAPVGPLLRRVGGVPGNLHDLRSLLRAGELVVRPLALDPRRPFGPGRPPHDALAVAVAAEVPVVAVRVEGPAWGRTRRVSVRASIPTRGPRRPADLDALARAVLEALSPGGR